MRVDVSVGEALDKLCILEIKFRKILDPTKRDEVSKEMVALEEAIVISKKYPYYYKILTYVNEKIWILTDDIKSGKKPDPDIFKLNDKRFRIKSFLNLLEDSEIKEQKSYTSLTCHIIVNSVDTFYKKISELNFLCMEFDAISFDSDYMHLAKDVLKHPNIKDDKFQKVINIEEFEVNDAAKYEPDPMTYICGGLFGDFIQNLSVPFEYFLKTGRKAVVYLANDNGGDNFRYGLENTYNDTKNIIMKQLFIKDFRVYNGEVFDVNLNDWRRSDLLYKTNLQEVYKMTYGVNWGSHQWLSADIDTIWADVTVINTTRARFPNNINFSDYKNAVFVSQQRSEYDYFRERTGIYLDYHQVNTFDEIVTIINSCKLFIGSLSAPLAIANALYKNRIAGLVSNSEDNAGVIGITDWKNFSY